MLELAMAAICFGIIWLVITLVNASDANDREINRRSSMKVRQRLSKNGKEKYFAYFKNDEYLAVIDNYLHVKVGRLKGKTNLNNVMGTEIKYHVSERNRMRFMSVMPTFDKHTRLVKIELILYRRGESDVNLILNPDIVSDQRIKKLKMVIDEIIEEGKSINH